MRRGAPCGATWEAAARVIGLSLDAAAVRIGLEVQYVCVADPAGWDPIHGKSPVHFAGKIHQQAFLKALAGVKTGWGSRMQTASINGDGSDDGRR